MLLSIRQDEVNKVLKEKKSIKLKAVTQLMLLKDSHNHELALMEQSSRQLQDKFKLIGKENSKFVEQLEKLNRTIKDLKAKKKQLQRTNNHLIDSLVIKQNQIKLANKHFKFKVFNQVHEDDQDQHHLLPDHHSSAGKKSNFIKRRSSKLFKPSLDAQVLKVQKELKNQITNRVNKLINNSKVNAGDESEGKSQRSKFSEVYNPNGNINSGLQYLEKNIKIQQEYEREDPEENIKKLAKIKIRLENLHDEEDLGERTMKHQGTDNQDFLSVANITPLKAQVKAQTPKAQHDLQEVSFKQHDNDSVNTHLLLQKHALLLSESDDLHHHTSESGDSSRHYENKGMQFPEDDVLTQGDFMELMEHTIEKPPVIVIREQYEQAESPVQKKTQKIGKFSKAKLKEEEQTTDQKNLVINLNLKQFATADSALDHNHSEFVILSEDSSDNHSQTGEPLQEVVQPDLTATQKLQSKKAKDAFNNFLEANEDQLVDELGEGDFGLTYDANEEENREYEEINEKNAMFYKEEAGSPRKAKLDMNDLKSKGGFYDKVDSITALILENMQNTKLTKKQFLQLIISNILKNEQEEIKQMIMDQYFGPDGTTPLTKGSPGKVGAGHNLPMYLMTKTQDQGLQTDTLWMIDFLECGVNPAEVFKFDRKAQKLVKYTFNRDDDQDIVKQQEFMSRYENLTDYYEEERKKLQQTNPIMAKLFDTARGAKLEITRSNIVLQELQYKIRDLEEYVSTMEQKKLELEQAMDKQFKVKDRFVQQFDLWVNSWHKGFVIGFERGMSSGYFKGAVENKDIGIQEGFQLGIKEGWQFGFDDGFKHGIRRIYQEAKDKGLDVSLITPMLHQFLSNQEKRQGIQQKIQQKLFQVSIYKTLAPVVKEQIDKFNNYNEKKKRHYAKLGLKSLIKMIRQFYTMKIGERDLLLSEFCFEEFQRKFGHNKMAKKAFIQFVASAFYHRKMHNKIDLFCSFILINEKPYSNDVANFYIQVTEGLLNSKIGLKNEYDEKTDHEITSLTKSVEVMREQLEFMLPIEIILELRKRVEKLQVKGKKSSQAFIDIDKYMDFMVSSYVKFHIDMFNKPQLTYFAWTLYEKNEMTINEIHLTIEVLSGDRINMKNEQRESIELHQKDLLKLFEEASTDLDKNGVRYNQFAAVMKDSDLFYTKEAKELFKQLPFRGNVNKFQDIYDEKSSYFKTVINDVYDNKEVVERMMRMDTKERWYDRLYAIERNIGEVNSTVLFLSLLLIGESLKYLKEYKTNILLIIWEERNGKKAPKNVSVEELTSEQSQFQERKIKVQIQSKVQEVAENASPTFMKRRLVVAKSPLKRGASMRSASGNSPQLRSSAKGSAEKAPDAKQEVEVKTEEIKIEKLSIE